MTRSGFTTGLFMAISTPIQVSNLVSTKIHTPKQADAIEPPAFDDTSNYFGLLDHQPARHLQLGSDSGCARFRCLGLRYPVLLFCVSPVNAVKNHYKAHYGANELAKGTDQCCRHCRLSHDHELRAVVEHLSRWQRSYKCTELRHNKSDAAY